MNVIISSIKERQRRLNHTLEKKGGPDKCIYSALPNQVLLPNFYSG